MNRKYNITDKIGILGAGSFGIVIANIISRKYNVLIYARKENSLQNINEKKIHRKISLNNNISATNNLEYLASNCKIIFPVIPSYSFREVLSKIEPFLTSNHIFIHCTKGFDIDQNLLDGNSKIYSEDIKTMSELITTLTPVIRVGCVSGPNLAKELANNEPAATVIASKYNEVIQIGKQLLHNSNFQVYGSDDIKGIELAGVFKNYIAIAAGLCSGIGMGENVKAFLITRGIAEMIEFGAILNVSSKSFLGLAGMGDLIATCNSPHSRNYSVGFRLGKGEKLEDILSSLTEAVEGLNTLKVLKQLSDTLNLKTPLIKIIHKVVFDNFPLEKGINILMRINTGSDSFIL